jgi:hypothetical protein
MENLFLKVSATDINGKLIDNTSYSLNSQMFVVLKKTKYFDRIPLGNAFNLNDHNECIKVRQSKKHLDLITESRDKESLKLISPTTTLPSIEDDKIFILSNPSKFFFNEQPKNLIYIIDVLEEIIYGLKKTEYNKLGFNKFDTGSVLLVKNGKLTKLKLSVNPIFDELSYYSMLDTIQSDYYKLLNKKILDECKSCTHKCKQYDFITDIHCSLKKVKV